MALATDLSFLAGLCVEQICVSAEASAINGEGRVSVKVFGGFAFNTSKQPCARLEGTMEGAAALLPLLGDGVRDAQATPDGGLKLDLNSGAALKIFSDSDQYECFTIEDGGVLTVVHLYSGEGPLPPRADICVPQLDMGEKSPSFREAVDACTVLV